MTGWPPGLLQDDCKKLSKWLASKPDARYIARKNIDMTDKKDPHAELMRLADSFATTSPGGLAVTRRDALDAYARTLTDRLERAERMFGAACADLGAINQALGLDPDDGGAEPIIDAIKELQANAPPLLTDDERRDEQAAFSAIELAAHAYADAYTELQCDSDNDRQRDHRNALTEMRRVIRAEITRFSRGNRALICGPSCTRCGRVCQKGREVDEQYASRLALELECMLIDPNGYWDSAAKVLDNYKAAWEAINPSPPTFMGEPVPPERKAIFAAMRAKREALKAPSCQKP